MADIQSSTRQKTEDQPDLIDITQLLSDFFRVLKRMWVWFLIFSIAGGAIAFVRAEFSYSPVYTASATFTVNAVSDGESNSETMQTYYNNTTAEQMSSTFPYILTSGLLRRRVAADMGVEAVSGRISAGVQENTNFFTLSVTDSDAQRAYATLQSVIANYPEISEKIVGKTSLEILDETGIPSEPDNPRNFRNRIAKGALAGLLLALLWSVFIVMTRRTVRTESDVHRYMNTRCLGLIPQIAQKRRSRDRDARTRILISDPKSDEHLQESFRMIRNKVEYYGREYHMKTFIITSALAGEGKSTIAVNLALALARTGKKVALIDCDLRHPSDREIFELPEGPGLGEILKGEVKLGECVLNGEDLHLDSKTQFIFIPGGKTISDGSELLGTKAMEAVINGMKEWADYIILDSAPAGLITDAVVLAEYADGAAFVVRKDFARIDYIMDGMTHLASSGIQIIGGILNGV